MSKHTNVNIFTNIYNCMRDCFSNCKQKSPTMFLPFLILYCSDSFGDKQYYNSLRVVSVNANANGDIDVNR